MRLVSVIGLLLVGACTPLPGPRVEPPPIATSPSGHSAVTSPNPLGNDAVFGSGFESLFGS